jgi:predicted CXXCH cytochrome family protein
MRSIYCLHFAQSLIALVFYLGFTNSVFSEQGEPAFLGSKQCKGCHESQSTEWRSSHHYHAMLPVSSESVLADFSGQHSLDAEKLSFRIKDEKYFVDIMGPDAVTSTYPVTHTFGFFPLQQYLIDIGGGRKQALPLAWDQRPVADGGQRWIDIYPETITEEDDPRHWAGIDQTWNYMCGECHSTDYAKNYKPDSQNYSTSWSEVNVACEACHGPGSAHVVWANDDGSGESSQQHNGLMVNLGSSTRWSFQLGKANAQSQPGPQASSQIDTCARCHARRGVLTEQYTHGLPLMDTHLPALLSAGLYHADGQIDEEVYVYGSFLQSRMYAKGVVCSDCHNAHSGELKHQGNALCAQCHRASVYDQPDHHFHKPESVGAQCVNCHMPSKTYMVVDPRRDHSFRIPRPRLSEKIKSPDVCTACHQAQSHEWAAQQIEKNRGEKEGPRAHFGEAIHAGRIQHSDSEQKLLNLIRNQDQPAIARATALGLIQAWLNPHNIDVITTQLGDPDPLIRWSALGTLEPLPVELKTQWVMPLLSDPVLAVRLQAARVLTSTLTDSPDTNNRQLVLAGIKAYIESQLVNADRPETHTAIGDILIPMGRYEQSEAAYRKAIDLDRGYLPAYVNLSDLMRVLGRDTDGSALLRAAIRRQPESAAAHHALGLLLARAADTEKAHVHLEKAVLLEPDNSRYQFVLAVARYSAGEIDAAFEILEKTYRKSSGNQEVLQALMAYSQEQNRFHDAYHYALALSGLRPWDDSTRKQMQLLKLAVENLE